MYQTTVDTYSLNDRTYTAYGIAFEDIRIDDLSFDKEAIDALVELYNRSGLDPLHLRDAVEDFLADQCQLTP